MLARTRSDNDIDSYSRERVDGNNGRLRTTLGAILIGLLVSVVSLALVAGIVWLARWSGFFSDWSASDRRLVTAVVAAMAMVSAAAVGSWAGVRWTRAPGVILVGAIVGFAFIVCSLLIVFPFVRPIADFRSVAIALDWIDAPNVGTGPTEALHEMAKDRSGQDSTPDSDIVGTAYARIRETAVFLTVVLGAVIAAGILGALVNKPEVRTSRLGAPAASRAGSTLAVVVGAVGILTVMLWSSVWTMTVTVVDFDQSAGPELGVTLSEVASHPGAMWDKPVTVSAEIDRLIDPHAAILGNDAPVVGSRLLVVSEQPLKEQIPLASASGATLGEGDVVQVSGVVRRYDPANIERTLGITIDEGAISNYESAAVLEVQSIDVDVPIASEAGDKELGGDSAGYDFGVTIHDIKSSPDEYVGMTVTVSDEVEERILTPHVFTLGDRAFIVISETQRPEIFVEATLYVTGEVRILDVEEVEQTLGIDLIDTLDEYEGEPFILVESTKLVK